MAHEINGQWVFCCKVNSFLITTIFLKTFRTTINYRDAFFAFFVNWTNRNQSNSGCFWKHRKRKSENVIRTMLKTMTSQNYVCWNKTAIICWLTIGNHDITNWCKTLGRIKYLVEIPYTCRIFFYSQFAIVREAIYLNCDIFRYVISINTMWMHSCH